ncbi:MAG: hypothetical protein KIS62_12040 [Ramlibacter sp.]|nr:hypothetical protein [Ramlibacter sp.]MBX3659164.1 hypothetical protein [Ramlibacter sp.]MCW5650468.1 hypothetical protein [Ramlibacter sp.]
MERITGPVKGYYIAAYTVESGDEFVGFAKICISQPDSVHNINAQHKVRSYHLYSTESQALESAEFRARETIAGLPANWHPFNLDSMMDSLRK